MFSRHRWRVKVGQAQEPPSGQQSSDFMVELYQSVYSEMEEEKRRLKATKIYRTSVDGTAGAGAAGGAAAASAPVDVTIHSIASNLDIPPMKEG